MAATLQAEIDSNYDFFQRSLGGLLGKREGEYALLRQQTIVDLYPTFVAAEAAGAAAFEDGIYSVQEVCDRQIDLGFFTHAIDQG